MAEVVGLVASVATLLHVARKVQEYGRDYFTADEQLEELGRTVSIFQTKLELLGKHGERAFKNPEDERFEALRVVLRSSTFIDSKGEKLGPDPNRRSVGALKRIENHMKETENDLKTLSQHNVESKVKKLWWHHYKKTFQKTIAKIDESIKQVDSVLAYDHFAISLETSNGVRKVLKNQEVEAEIRQAQRKTDADEREKVRREEAEERQKASEKQAQATERLRRENAELWEKGRRELAEERQHAAREREQELKERKRAAIIEWLSPLSFQARQSEIYNQCIQQNVSAPSLLASVEFETWTAGTPWRLQCVGEPGAGKTFLCALVIERLKEILRGRNVPILCIYLNYKESSVQTLDNLISSLLKQLLQHPNAEFKSPEAKRLFSGAENESRPTLEDFYEAFRAEIWHFERYVVSIYVRLSYVMLNRGLENYRVMIIVDAYDEASPSVKDRLADRLMSLPTEKASLMITSRPIEDEPELEGTMFCDFCGRGRPTDDIPPLPPLKIYHHCEICDIDICPSCKAEDLYCKDRRHILKQPDEVRMSIEPSQADIQLYVQKELELELRLGNLNHSDTRITKSSFGTTRLGRICRRRPDLQERIIPTIVLNANSMFTLAGLYMQTLRACISEGEVEDALDDPPEGYDGFYERNMLRITEDSESIRASTLARKTLEWIVHAYRPLSLRELKDALAVDLNKAGFRKAARPDKATILEVTAGMVMIDLDEKSVRLNHRTAQEYFDKTRDRWFTTASANLTRVSLHYMRLGELTKPCEGIYEDRDFDARKKAYPLLEYAYIYWGDHACEVGQHSETEAAVLEYVSDNDKIAAWTQAVWYLRSAERAEWDIRKGATALHVCAWFGLTDAVARLLDEGLDVNAADPNYKQTPLMYACRRGQSVTVAKLLERGADVNQYSQRDSVALFEALDNGVLETVELLLSRRELDVNAIHPRRYNRTALMLAAQNGKLEIVNALLDRPDTKRDRKDLDGNTALSLATIAGQSDIVETLLEQKGVCIDSQNSLGSTALILAATTTSGRKEIAGKMLIATLLLEQGADTSIKDCEGGGTAILRAVDAGNVAMVKLLLDYDADIETRDDLNRGLLHSAAIDGHEEIVRLLLEKRLDVNAQDRNRKTPLHDASRNGDYSIAELLLDSGADQSIKEKDGRTPRTIAWQYGNLKVMKLLDREDGNDNQILQGSYPRVHLLPMWSLANLGFEQQVKDMIANKPNEIYFCDPDMGNTAIHCAINANNSTILTLLLTAGLSPDSVNDYYRTPLHLAAIRGHTNLIAILLNNHAKVDEKDKWRQTPLQIAHENRYLECAVILIEAGATPTSPNMIETLMFASVEFGHVTAVTKLIELGADLSVKNMLGQTALQIAKEAGRDEIVQVLRANKSVFRSPKVGSDVTEVLEEEEAEEQMAMLSMKESPFHKPEVWNEEESEGEETVVANAAKKSVVRKATSERRVRILEPAV